MWSCLRPVPGRAALPAWGRDCCPRCGRSRGRCSPYTWTPLPPSLAARFVPHRPTRHRPARVSPWPCRVGRLLWRPTVDEKGYDPSLTAGGMLTLLEAAWRVVPAVEELPIDEMWVGHRPGSRDDAPILGAGPIDGLIYATGHHRTGIMLTPITAHALARLVL